jgi:hypothetical protein
MNQNEIEQMNETEIAEQIKERRAMFLEAARSKDIEEYYIKEYFEEAENQDGPEYWLHFDTAEDFLKDFEVACIELRAIQYHTDNQDLYTTRLWIHGHHDHIDVAPWALLEDLIENMPISEMLCDRIVESLQAMRAEIDAAAAWNDSPIDLE